MAPRSSSFDAASSLPRHLRARLLRRMVDALLRTPLHHPRRGRGSYTRRGGRRSGNAVAGRGAHAHSHNSSTNAHQRGNSEIQQGGPVMVTAFCPRHGRSIYPCGNDGSSSESTPATPPTSPTPAPPPDLLLRGTIAARRDAPYFSMTTGSSSSRLPTATPPPLSAGQRDCRPPDRNSGGNHAHCHHPDRSSSGGNQHPSRLPPPHHPDRASSGRDERRRRGKTPPTLR